MNIDECVPPLVDMFIKGKIFGKVLNSFSGRTFVCQVEETDSVSNSAALREEIFERKNIYLLDTIIQKHKFNATYRQYIVFLTG